MSAKAEDTQALLSSLLEVARRRLGVSALALADDQGLLIAGAGRHASCESLAALAPLSQGASRQLSMDLWGRPIHLCAAYRFGDPRRAEWVLQQVRQVLAPPLSWVA
jgi:hypothetical protein